MKLTIPQFRKRVGRLSNDLPKAVIGGIRAGLLLSQRTAKREFILDRSGKALPPPGPLTNRSGKLRGSIRIREPRREGRTFVGALVAGGSGVRYARVHELGGRRMPARPYLRPALQKNVRQIEKQIGVALDTMFKRTFR